MNIDLNVVSPFAGYLASFFESSEFVSSWLFLFFSIALYWFALVLPPVFLAGFIDRKLSADIQMRIGPNRVSPYGLVQPLADLIKALFKEDSSPENSEPFLGRWSTIGAIVFVFFALSSIPFSQNWVLSNLDSSIVFAVIALAFSNLCLFWGAYSVKSSWSVISAYRVLSMIASFIVPVSIAIVAPIIIAGSTSFQQIIETQGGAPWKWNAFHNPGTMLTFCVLFLGLLVWQGREPFEITVAHGEVAGGYRAECSGTRRALLEFLEFLSLFLAAVFLTATYLGGWRTPFNLESFGRAADIVQWIIFMVKAFSLVLISIWIRWSMPRQRIDQLVHFSWKVLVPVGLSGTIVTAIWMVLTHGRGIGDFL